MYPRLALYVAKDDFKFLLRYKNHSAHGRISALSMGLLMASPTQYLIFTFKIKYLSIYGTIHSIFSSHNEPKFQEIL